MALMATAMWAAPVSIFNTRPVTINAAAPGELSLQAIIDGMWTGTDVDTDQNPWGMFKNSNLTPPGTSAARIRAEFTSGAFSQIFGVFSPADSSAGVRFEQPIFKGSATVATSSATLDWDSTGTLLSIYGNCATVYCVTDVPISFYEFGFFFANSDTSPRFYTVDALSPNQAPPRVLSFARPGAGATEYAFAYEDGSDFDYQDMVVKVESIQAVPEPASVLLLGTLLLGIGGLVRRKMTR